MLEKQLTLFGEDCGELERPKGKNGGSGNPIVFHDYESFIAKFNDNPKTTDDCYTPKDVYEAVVQYVGTIVDLTNKKILRPFYPGGDYEHSDYPEDGIVIDNPPFSIFKRCCAFYTTHNIPFFLFGPGLTITRCCKYCTAVIVDNSIMFENGANVKCNFASNLYGDIVITTAPLLNDLISKCKSQKKGSNLPKFKYPYEFLSISEMQRICKNNILFSVNRKECEIVNHLDNYPSLSGLFGSQFILSSEKAHEKTAAKESFYNKPEKEEIPIELSQREKLIVERLNQNK